jgi:hypothetical protein
MVTAAVNDWVEQYTHRSWGVIKSIVAERYDFKDTIWLRHPDVVSVDAVVIGYPGQSQETISPGNYFSNALGRVTLYWGAHLPQSKWNNDLLSISYTYGVLTVPNDLKLAALGIAAVMYNFAINGQQNIVSSSVGSYHVQTIGAIRGAGGVKPNSAMNTAEANYAIIDSYVMRRQ